jgi:hypothetical protein
LALKEHPAEVDALYNKIIKTPPQLLVLNTLLTLIYFLHCTHILLFFNNIICYVIYLKFSKYLVFFLSISIQNVP